MTLLGLGDKALTFSTPILRCIPAAPIIAATPTATVAIPKAPRAATGPSKRLEDELEALGVLVCCIELSTFSGALDRFELPETAKADVARRGGGTVEDDAGLDEADATTDDVPLLLGEILVHFVDALLIDGADDWLLRRRVSSFTRCRCRQRRTAGTVRHAVVRAN